MAEVRRCPQCDAELPPETPQGLCPQCLLKAGLVSESAAGLDSEPTRPVSPAGSERGETLSTGNGADVSEHPPGTKIRYFGDYELLEEVARGGMGVVYKARQVSLSRIVALKMILGGQLASEEEVQRFHAEAEAAAQLNHPSIVPIYEVGKHEDQHYFSMAFVEGGSLADKIKAGPVPARQAAEYVRKVTEAVAYAHEKGVIHRDLKPSNVLLESSGDPKVTDFGLAKRVQGGSDLTATGQILGTPGYMPPEQASGEIGKVNEQVDIYALGAILYVLVAGRPPFQADNPLDTLKQVLERDPISPRELNPASPRDLETICMKCLEKDHRNRYGSAHDLADELQRFLTGEPIRARPISGLERARRWCRRNPVVAGLTIALLFVLIAGTSVSTYFARREAHRANEASEQARRAYGHYYVAEMNLAQRDWQAADVGNLLKRLERTKPNRTGGHDYRGFEWFYWDRLCHSDIFTVNHSERVYCVAFDPDGSRLATASADRTVKLWDSQRGKEIATLKPSGKLSIPMSLSFRPDGIRLAMGTNEGVVTLWDTRTAQVVLTLEAHSDSVPAVAFSPDGARLASAGDGDVKVWDAQTGKRLLVLEGGGSSVTYSPDGTALASVGKGGRQGAHVWDSSSGRVIRTLQGRGGRILYDLAFSPDGTRLATGSEDGTVQMWETNSGKELLSLDGHQNYVYSVAFSPDGARLASGSSDGTVKLWDVKTGKELTTLKGHVNSVLDVTFHPAGARVVSCSSDGAVKMWDADPRQSVFQEHTGSVTSVAFHPDNGSLASGSVDSNVILWDSETGEPIHVLSGHIESVRSVAFSADGSRLASGGEDRTAKVWSSGTGVEVITIEGHADGVKAVALNADGTQLVSGSLDSTVRVWDVKTGQELLKLEAGGSVYGVAFRPDSRRVAAAIQNQPVKLWDVRSGQEVLSVSIDHRRTLCVAFSPDGTRLACGSSSGAVFVVDTETGKVNETLSGHVRPVRSLAYSPDGARLASDSADGVVKLWDTVIGQEILTLEGSGGGVAFSPDGHRLAIGHRSLDANGWITVREAPVSRRSETRS